MKNKFYLLLILALSQTTGIFAQKSVEVKENVVLMSLGERTGFTITLAGENEKDATRALKDWIESMQKKPSIDEAGKHEIKIDDLKRATLSENPIDIYFLFNETKEGVIVTGFFELNGAFVSSTTNPEKVKEITSMMQNFSYRIEKISLEKKVVLAKKVLGERNDEQIELQKKNKQLNDQIEEWNKSIEKAKGDIHQNEKDQDGKKSEISTSEQLLKELEKELNIYSGY